MPFTPPLYQELRSRDYDVIQCSDFFQWGTLLASLAHNKKKASMFIWQELDTYYQVLPARVLQEVYYKTIGRMVVEKLTGFIPRSMSARNHLWKIGLPRCKIYKVIPTGVNTEVFHPIKNSNVKEDFGVNDRPLLLAVGRLHPNKNFGFLINTMKKVVQREPDAYLIIKGNGPQKCTLETLIRVLKLDSNVKIISQHLSREEMVKLYNACDFLIIPSKIDLFPFVCLEALACGKPVISTFGKALKDLIGDGKAGVILENADENELSKCIVYLINNPDVVRKMGEAAFKRAQNKYSMTVVANEFIRIYERSLMD
jgi:glycosyltransferase involved in cell wall biosynthesis